MSSSVVPPAPPTARLAAVWFADIVGYSQISAEDEPAAMCLVENFQTTASQEIERCSGRLVKFIGDAALAEFTSTGAAVRAAIALESEFAARTDACGLPARVRIGVHLGEIAALGDGDIYGDGVNVASRLQGEAAPGQVVVSEDVWRQLCKQPDFHCTALGERRLKNIPTPVKAFAVSLAEADPAAPRFARGRRALSGGRGRRPPFGVDLGTRRGKVLFGAGVALSLLTVGYPVSTRDGLFCLPILGNRCGVDSGTEPPPPLGGLELSRVAVLYFKDLTPGGEQQYLADGLTEDLIGELNQIHALDVISTNGVGQFRDAELPRDSIARLLEVGTVVDGTIEQAGDRVRMNVRLVDGESGAEIHRKGFELPDSDLLAVRDSLVEETARSLREWLGQEVQLRRTRQGTRSTAAWVLLQRAGKARKDAESLLHADDLAGMAQAFQRADDLLVQAAAQDPAWADPPLLRATVAYRQSRLAEDSREAVEWIRKGIGHAERALELAPNDARALELRGTLRYWHYSLNVTQDPEELARLLGAAREDLEAAVRIDPTLASAHSTLSHLYYQEDDMQSVVRAANKAYEEDAYLEVAPEILWRLFSGFYDLEQFAQARRWCEEGARRFGDDYRFAQCQLTAMTAPGAQPDAGRAWRLVARVDSLAPEPRRAYERARAQMFAGGALAAAGLPDSARAVLLRARADEHTDPTRDLLFVEAYMRTLLGDQDEAIDLLKQYAAATHAASFEHYWWWRSLQAHPRFGELPAHH